MQKIEVVPYRKEWPELFLEENKKITSLMDGNLVKIEHIGSTSVPNLAAKPIIDILLIVEDINKLDQQNKNFEELGYEVMGEFGIPGRRYYRKGGDNRTHQIHAFQYDAVYDIERHLAFRDYLRAHSEFAKEYAAVKTDVASRMGIDIEDYNDGKDTFVKEHEKKALIWYWQNRNKIKEQGND